MMLKRGDHIILRMTDEGIYLNERELLKADDVIIGLGIHKNYEPKRTGWIKIRVRRYSEGALDCDIIEFNVRDPQQFYTQQIDEGAVCKLLLCGSNTNLLISMAGQHEVYEPAFDYDVYRGHSGGSNTQKKALQTREGSGAPNDLRRIHQPVLSPVGGAAVMPDPRPAVLPVIEHQQEYKFRFDEMEIVDGAALFHIHFQIPRNYRSVPVEFRVENNFLQSGFDFIKDYLCKCLKRKTIEVEATIRTQGPEVVSVEATAPLVAKINSSLLEDVKYQFIKRALRDSDEDSNIITVGGGSIGFAIRRDLET